MSVLTSKQETAEVLKVFIGIWERALNEHNIGEGLKANGITISLDRLSEILDKLSDDKHLNKETGTAYEPMAIKGVTFYKVTEKGKNYFSDLTERRFLKKMLIQIRNHPNEVMIILTLIGAIATIIGVYFAYIPLKHKNICP